MKPPCGQSSNVLLTLDTGEDFVGLLCKTHRREKNRCTVKVKVNSQTVSSYNHVTVKTNIPDKFSPLIHKKQRNYIKHICALGTQTRKQCLYLPSVIIQTVWLIWRGYGVEHAVLGLPEAIWWALVDFSHGRGWAVGSSGLGPSSYWLPHCPFPPAPSSGKRKQMFHFHSWPNGTSTNYHRLVMVEVHVHL